jgi:hypothetical protein
MFIFQKLLYIPKKLIIFVREFKQTLHKKIQNTMKKSILTVAAAIITAFSANAQSGYEDTKHEAGISFGWGSTSQFFDTFETVTKSIAGKRLKSLICQEREFTLSGQKEKHGK